MATCPRVSDCTRTLANLAPRALRPAATASSTMATTTSTTLLLASSFILSVHPALLATRETPWSILLRLPSAKCPQCSPSSQSSSPCPHPPSQQGGPPRASGEPLVPSAGVRRFRPSDNPWSLERMIHRLCIGVAAAATVLLRRGSRRGGLSIIVYSLCPSCSSGHARDSMVHPAQAAVGKVPPVLSVVPKFVPLSTSTLSAGRATARVRGPPGPIRWCSPLPSKR